jgi:hypothetical protein
VQKVKAGPAILDGLRSQHDVLNFFASAKTLRDAISKVRRRSRFPSDSLASLICFTQITCQMKRVCFKSHAPWFT